MKPTPPVLPILSPSAADLLRDMAAGPESETISIEEIIAGLGNQGFGLLVLALALPNAIPGPLIPGFSVPFALGIIGLSIQILRGHRRPLLPGWLRRRRIRRERFHRFITRAEPILRRFERWFKPRPARFIRQGGDQPRPLGLLLILFSLVLALPIPLGNGPEAFALCVLGLGMFEDDEKVQGMGVAIGALATVLNVGIVIAGLRLLHYGIRHFG